MSVWSVSELLYASTARFTEKTTWTTEVLISDTAANPVCAIPPYFFGSSPTSEGRGIRICAKGYVSTTTGTNTFTFTIRAGVAGSITSAILLGSQALTATASISNIPWYLEGDVFLRTVAPAGGAASVVQGEGMIWSNAFTTQGGMNRLAGGAAANGSDGIATTFDLSITNFINFNAACSVSNAANKLRIEQLSVLALN
jgi:hypothetical protein